jgi:hypothetical protein
VADATGYECLDIFVAVADFSADPDERRTPPLHSPIGKRAFGDAKNLCDGLTRFECHALSIRLAGEPALHLMGRNMRGLFGVES